MSAHHLASFNWGVLRHDWDDPRVADFADNIDRVNAVAQRAPGFVWMLDEAGMDAAQRDESGPLGANLRMASTLSVWQGPAELRDFAFKTVHNQFYKRGPEWFDPAQGLRLVMWWVPTGHRPTITEACAKRDALTRNGETAEAFGWAWLKDHPLP